MSSGARGSGDGAPRGHPAAVRTAGPSVFSVSSAISPVAYRPADPLPGPPAAGAVLALLEHLANRAHMVLATGLLDPEAHSGIMQHADTRMLLHEPALSSIGAAVQNLARLGPEHPGGLVRSRSRMRRSTLPQAQIRCATAERHAGVVIPFEPALHASAAGDAQSRRPGRAYGEAPRQVIERSTERLALVDP